MNNSELNIATENLNIAKISYEEAGKRLAEAREVFDLILKRTREACIQRFYDLDAYAVAFIDKEEMGGSGVLLKIMVKHGMQIANKDSFKRDYVRTLELISFDSSVDLHVSYTTISPLDITEKFLNCRVYLIKTQTQFDTLLSRLVTLPSTVGEVEILLSDCEAYSV